LQYFLRLVNALEIPSREVLDPPTEKAVLVALFQSGAHLKATVTFDPVELLLVAASSMQELLSQPMAQFDPAVRTDYLVPLPLEQSLGI
jgi:hypothetical protein